MKKPPTQYGAYVTLSNTHPSKEEIRYSKKLLCLSFRKVKDEKKIRFFDLRLIVHNDWEYIDPETYESIRVGLVALKGFGKE